MITLAGSGKTKMYTRAEWSARAPRGRTGFTPSFGTTAHWNGPKIGIRSHDACASYVRGIQNFHMNGRGWTDVAYTAIVCPHGYVFECRWIGWRTGANGTNIGNSSAYAVCYLGGEGDGYTPEGDRAMHDTMTHLRRHGRAGKGTNCHRDWKPTGCPGDKICTRVKSGVYSTDAKPATTKPPTQEDDEVKRFRIVWFTGEPTAPGDQPDTTAAYKVIESLDSISNKWFGESATWIDSPKDLAILQYIGMTTPKAGDMGSQQLPLPIIDWNAGLVFFGGPFQTR